MAEGLPHVVVSNDGEVALIQVLPEGDLIRVTRTDGTPVTSVSDFLFCFPVGKPSLFDLDVCQAEEDA